MLAPLGSTGQTPFVGRAAELALLDSLWSAARIGSGRTALVSGPAGIGKSRLVREFAASPDTSGAVIASGASYDGEGGLPFGAVREALRMLTRGVPSDVTGALREALEALSGADEHMARQRQFESVVAALEAATDRGQPCLLIIEDLHWADESTLLLLTHVARQIRSLPVLLVATSRPEDSLQPASLHVLTEAVRREYLGERIALQPLPDDAARQLVVSTTDRLPDATIDLLVARGDGHPFFLEELARDAAATPAISGTHVPHAVTDLILYRLARLPRETRAVAEAAAVLSESARGPLLRDAIGQTPEQVAGAIDSLVALGVLQSNDVARVRFRHALFRDAVYASIPLTRRGELHLAAAEALIAQQGDEAAAEIGAHLEAEGSRESLRRAATLFAAAARRSLSLIAYEDAARQIERALPLLGNAEESRRQRLEFELLLARAQRLAGDTTAALKVFRSCADHAAELGEAGSQAEAALGFEQAYLATGRPRTDPDAFSIPLLTRALAAVGKADPALRSRLLAALSQARYFAGDSGSADSLSLESLTLAQSCSDRSAEAAALEARRVVAWGPDDLQGRLAISRSIAELGLATADRERELQGLYWEIGCLVEAGSVIEAQLTLRRFEALARDLGNPLLLSETERMEGMLAALHGDIDQARACADESMRLGLRAGYDDVRIHHVAAMIELLEDSGEDQSLILELIRDPGPWLQSPVRRGLLSHLSSRVGRFEDAERLIAGLATNGFAALPRDWMWLPMMHLISDAVRRLDNAAWAREIYELLLPYADRLIVNSNTTCYGSVELTLGSLAAIMQEASAESHIRRAIERHRQIDAPVFVARARERLGTLLLSFGRRQEAIEELSRACDAYRSYKLAAAAERVDALLRPPEPAKASRTEGLTDREVEVLRLLASGASNKEIADRLYLSVRTVERHITNLYAKIGARGKADATAYALRRGLLG